MLKTASNWSPPEHWQRIVTLDAHCAGEPLRIVLAGYPEIPGHTILDRRAFAREHLDHLRTALMWEPRGHADMYGCLIVPPESDDADFGVLFLHNEGYSSMCGHGIIAVVSALIETGALPPEPERVISIDTPAGRVEATPNLLDGQLTGVSFDNVPSFVVELDCDVKVPELGQVRYDLAFGGAFYAYVDGNQFDPPIRCMPGEIERMIALGKRIKQAVASSREIVHPFEADLSFLYGVIFTGPPLEPDNHSRNCCIFAEGEVDRSPTGTGVSGRATIHHARQEMSRGDRIRIESVLGTCFDVEIVREVKFGPYQAIVPRVTGQAHLTGRNEFFLDPNDPLRTGFLLR
ncbi:MAG: proline racemase family protein [Pirellulales bacterium]|nr:proline racemase family protein [Pirellulales bacterium]